MKHIALWIQNRVRSNSSPPAPPSSPGSPDVRQKGTSAITPENVPQFVIPSRQRKLGVIRTRSDGVVDTNNNCIDIITEAAPQRAYRKVASMPSQMCDLSSEDADSDGAASESAFPHLRTKTSSYGFTFVSEAPNTHRKESLFMGGESLEMLQEFQKRHNSCIAESANADERPRVDRRTASIPIMKRPIDGIYSKSLPSKIKSCVSLQRPASLVDLSFVSKRNDTRRTLNCPSSIDGEEPTNMSAIGELQLSLFYHKSQHQLEVKLLRGQNLMTNLEDVECNSYVKVCLEPGKSVKQRTSTVRGSRHPVYDTTLMFRNVSRSDLKSKTVRVRVYNEVGSAVPLCNKKTVIGEVLLPLSELRLETSQEYAGWHDLDDITDSLCTCCLHTTVELNKNEDQLYITVGEMRNLRPSCPPDSYVTVCVTQQGRGAVQKQTQVKKSSSAPVFNEIFAFSIAASIDKLPTTTITLKVMSKGRLRNHVTVGEVQLTGTTSSDRLIFWSNLLNVAKHKTSRWCVISAAPKL